MARSSSIPVTVKITVNAPVTYHRETVHACPPEGKGFTPCCGRTPFDLPRTDRMTLDSSLVTCTHRTSRSKL